MEDLQEAQEAQESRPLTQDEVAVAVHQWAQGDRGSLLLRVPLPNNN